MSRGEYNRLLARPTTYFSDHPPNAYMLKSEEYIMAGDKLTLERYWVGVAGVVPEVFTERRSCPSGGWATHTEYRVEKDKECK